MPWGQVGPESIRFGLLSFFFYWPEGLVHEHSTHTRAGNSPDQLMDFLQFKLVPIRENLTEMASSQEGTFVSAPGDKSSKSDDKQQNQSHDIIAHLLYFVHFQIK